MHCGRKAISPTDVLFWPHLNGGRLRSTTSRIADASRLRYSETMTAIDFSAFVDQLASVSGETILPFFPVKSPRSHFFWNPELHEGFSVFGQTQDALKKIELGLRKSPASARGWNAWAELLLRSGRLQEALSAAIRFDASAFVGSG